MTADDLIEALRSARAEHGDLPLSFVPLPNAQYGYMEGVTPVEGDDQFHAGHKCFVIEYVPR